MVVRSEEKLTEIFLMAKVVRVENDEEKKNDKYTKTTFWFTTIDHNFQNLLQAYLDLQNKKGDRVKVI